MAASRDEEARNGMIEPETRMGQVVNCVEYADGQRVGDVDLQRQCVGGGNRFAQARPGKDPRQLAYVQRAKQVRAAPLLADAPQEAAIAGLAPRAIWETSVRARIAEIAKIEN